MEKQTENERGVDEKETATNTIGGQQVNKAINALQKPTSFLLFILLLILVLEGVQYFEAVSKQKGLSILLTEIEKNRGAELQECNETVRYLSERIGEGNK